jgi:uncharacterized PurR-regulated membrane protein YhhQ (DUF165 family)
MRTAAALGFLACILAANYITTRLGMVPIGFGLTATAGTYLAGASFVLRDTIQDTMGRRVALGLIILGAGLSFAVSAPQIAIASGVAFAFSETADMAIYTPLRRMGYVRAAIASNIAGAIVDTFLFLSIAGFPIAGAWQGQIIGKLAVTAAVVAAVVMVRSRRPQVTT